MNLHIEIMLLVTIIFIVLNLVMMVWVNETTKARYKIIEKSFDELIDILREFVKPF